jgi:prepilin-type N-terminal cleavage/methylation domain-containing protein
MVRQKKAFTLIELLVVVAIIALLISILLPSLQRARELSKRTVCAANVRGIGQACKIYSNEDPEDLLPLVPYNATKTSFSYINQIGVSRDTITNTSSLSASTTRCLWMLVRGTTGGSVTVKQFRCPSSDDTVDDTEDLNRYYDFKGYRQISYGYQVPYGSQNQTRPSESIDIRMGLIADKGPFSIAGSTANPGGGIPDEAQAYNRPNGQQNVQYPTDVEKNSLEKWVVFNSPNHGGQSNGEGQNVLFGDSHVDFQRKPIVGVDEDNIYGVLDPREPWKLNTSKQVSANAIPGVDVLDSQGDSSTDTLIYP